MLDISERQEYLPVMAPIEVAATFKYVRESIATDVYAADPSAFEPYDGCDCSPELGGGGCCCTEAGECSCLQRCFGAQYDGCTGRLTAAMLAGCGGETQKPVLECNAACSCHRANSPCANRIVQNGQRLPLEVFRTPSKGYGLRSLMPIAFGTFVCEYVGEVLTAREARFRTATATARRTDRCDAPAAADVAATYLLGLRECIGGGRRLVTFVDAERYGNAARFINHSCQPNLTAMAVRVDNALPRVALFANRDIAAREELTFSYGSPAWQPPVGSASKAEHELRGDGGTECSTDDVPALPRGSRQASRPCLCGADHCQGYLPYDPDLFEEEHQPA